MTYISFGVWQEVRCLPIFYVTRNYSFVQLPPQRSNEELIQGNQRLKVQTIELAGTIDRLKREQAEDIRARKSGSVQRLRNSAAPKQSPRANAAIAASQRQQLGGARTPVAGGDLGTF